MSSTVKVLYLVGTEIKHVYIFKGADPSDDTGTTYDAPSTEITAYIHNDDSVGTIKRKLIAATSLPLSSSEIYLFGVRRETLDPLVIYNRLTQGETVSLSGQRLCAYLANLVDHQDCPPQLETDTPHDYDALLSVPGLNWDGPLDVTTAIGQKMVLHKTYPITVNPYLCRWADPLLVSDGRRMIVTQNTSLLFEYGPFLNNEIYICLASDVLEYMQRTGGVNSKYVLQTYFPALIEKDQIETFVELQKAKLALAKKEQSAIGAQFEKRNARVDLLYEIHANTTGSLPYIDQTPGLVSLTFIMHPPYAIKFPLAAIFKVINSTRTMPLVKYNPGTRRENIYRLFTGHAVAANGKQIPYLYSESGDKKLEIIKISKRIARRHSVAFYIGIEYASHHYRITCEFRESGSLRVHFDIGHPLSITEIQTILQLALNAPLLSRVTEYLAQSGYNYMTFNSLVDRNVELQEATYVLTLTMKKNIHLMDYLGCLSSVFTVISGNLDATSERISMRYKRVSNFNVLGSEETFINELRQRHVPLEQIIKKLELNFGISSEAARLKFVSWASQVRTEADLFENKRLTVRTNTGFPVFIRRDRASLATTVIVEGINDIRYIPHLRTYVDSLLRLVLKDTPGIPRKQIDRLCKGALLADVVEEDDIGPKPPVFPKEEDEDALVYGEQEDDDDVADFMALLGDDDDEEPLVFGDIIGDTPISATNTPPSRQTTPEPIKSKSSPSSDASSEAEVDLTGLPLKGPRNIFTVRKLKRDPALFLKKGSQKYQAYSKACPTQYRRQPVILTNEEKAYIDKQDHTHGAKSYDEYITYGSGSTKYHYICPRFWCLYDENGRQRSLTLKEINEGACGGWDSLIDQKAKKIPPGKRIYEFTDRRFHRERPPGSEPPDTKNRLVYKPMFPGFQKGESHPDNLCVPCCFIRPRTYGYKDRWIKKGTGAHTHYTNLDNGKQVKSLPRIKLQNMYRPVGMGPGGAGPDYEVDAKGNIILTSIKGRSQLRELPSESRKAAYDECNQESTQPKSPAKGKTLKIDQTPLDEVSFPVGPGQLAFLSNAVQIFLGYGRQKDLLAKQRRLPRGKPFLLRQGVENSQRQSFLACIADLYSDKDVKGDIGPRMLSRKLPLKIADFKEIVINILDLDTFITFQNGSLAKLFAKGTPRDLAEYSKGRLFDIIGQKIEDTSVALYFEDIVAAFQNFLAFLRNDAVLIDYEYMWDIICTPASEGGLFQKGLNLIILHEPKDDLSSRMEVICPTNHFSKKVFSPDRPILLLYTHNGYFEPIYQYTRTSQNKYNIRKTFSISQSTHLSELESVLEVIRTKMISGCQPLPSLPHRYEDKLHFRPNITLDQLILELDKRTDWLQTI